MITDIIPLLTWCWWIHMNSYSKNISKVNGSSTVAFPTTVGLSLVRVSAEPRPQRTRTKLGNGSVCHDLIGTSVINLPLDLSATLTATLKATLVKQLDTIYTMFEIHLIISYSCKDVPRHWLVFVLQIHEVLDNPWHQPRTFPAFQTEEEGRGGEKEKTPGHEVGKVDKNSNSILWQGGPMWP